jgi:hypothetical protein
VTLSSHSTHLIFLAYFIIIINDDRLGINFCLCEPFEIC